jgi:predicted 2-oxoglutarate/Fe(II)-dependent dioxygenase YbiX
MFDGERKGIPILSCLGLLNDDYEGGEFIMFDDMKIDFKKGDLLIFPSNFLYPHKVQPVTKGTRYSYISWVW